MINAIGECSIVQAACAMDAPSLCLRRLRKAMERKRIHYVRLGLVVNAAGTELEMNTKVGNETMREEELKQLDDWYKSFFPAKYFTTLFFWKLPSFFSPAMSVEVKSYYDAAVASSNNVDSVDADSDELDMPDVDVDDVGDAESGAAEPTGGDDVNMATTRRSEDIIVWENLIVWGDAYPHPRDHEAHIEEDDDANDRVNEYVLYTRCR